MEAKSALIRAYRAVELYSVTLVYMHFTLVVHPGNAEHYHPFRFDKSFEKAGLFILGVLLHYGCERSKYLGCGLVELGLAGIALFKII